MPLAIVALAFGLRLYRLDAQDLWWDEGSSMWQAPMSLHEIALYQARDQHPPLYYWLLHGWYRLAGGTVFALRLLSAQWSTLEVALAYALGKRLLRSVRAAAIAALILAVSRFHIEWAQELKMYALAGALSMFSLWLAVRLWDQGAPPQRGLRGYLARPWPAYVVVTILAAYAHYISYLAVVAQNVYLLGALYQQRRRGHPWQPQWWRWFAAQAAIAAAGLPWFVLSKGQAVTWEPSPVTPPLQMVRMVATLLSLGISAYVERYTWEVLLLWLPALAALVYAVLRRRHIGRDAMVWVALLVPWALTYLLTLPAVAWGYEAKLAARFFMLCTLPYALVTGRGLALLARKWTLATPLGLAVVLAISLPHLGAYFWGRYPRDAYDSLARALQAHAREGEAVMLLNDADWPIFHAYYQGGLPHYHLPGGAPGGQALIEPYVAPPWERHEGLWLVTIPQGWAQDPERAVASWLEEQGQLVYEERFGERSLALYRREPRDMAVRPDDGYQPQHPVNQPVTEGAFLVGYDQPLSEARTGMVVRLATIWRVDPGHSYRLQVALIDAEGRRVGPAGEWVELAALAPGGLTRVRLDLPIPPSMPSGRFRVAVWLADAQGEPVAQATLGRLRVRRTVEPGAGQARFPVNYRLGQAITLEGYDLVERPYRPGDHVEIALHWHAADRSERDYTVFVHIVGPHNPRTGNPLWGQVDRMPVKGLYPTSAWLPGEVILDRYLVPLDKDIAPGVYTVVVGLYVLETGDRLPVFDAQGQAVGDQIVLGRIRVAP